MVGKAALARLESAALPLAKPNSQHVRPVGLIDRAKSRRSPPILPGSALVQEWVYRRVKTAIGDVRCHHGGRARRQSLGTNQADGRCIAAIGPRLVREAFRRISKPLKECLDAIMYWIDPDYLPEVLGTVTQFLINPHGEIDGMILDEGVEVHFPPHMSRSIGGAVAVGDKIKVRGVRPRSSDVIAGVALDTANGNRITDDGPPSPDGKHGKAKRKPPAREEGKTIEAVGVVLRALHGPKGEVRGVLLEDGAAIRFPKHAQPGKKALTVKGAKFTARGHIVKSKFGVVIAADKIGSSRKTLRKLTLHGPGHEKDHRREA